MAKGIDSFIKKPTFKDSLVFLIVNLCIYLSHPRFTLRYIRKQKRLPNFAEPCRLTELVQWRKLFDRNPLFPLFVDKLRSKEWVRERCPTLAIPETVWVGQRPEDIPQALIAPGYVIKTNHGWNQNYFPHRETLDRNTINTRFNRWLQGSLADYGEWAYGQVERRVFVERLLPSNGPLADLTFRGHNGSISLATVATDFKTPEQKSAYYTPEGIRAEVDLEQLDAMSLPADFSLPSVFDEALAHAKTLSLGIDFVRVDFIWGGDRLHFSELTVYPSSGYGKDNALADMVFQCWLVAMHKCRFLNTQHLWPMSIYSGAFSRRYKGSLSDGPASPSQIECPRRCPPA